MKKGILLKISGEWLKNDETIISIDKLDNLRNQVKVLLEQYNVAIVVGGGNIFRGRISEELKLNQSQGDSVGMLATVINGKIITDYFNNNNLKTILYSALSIPNIADEDRVAHIKKNFLSGNVIIFSGGTGMPFFTTDTCAAVRAAQLGIETILFGKNGTNGLYDSDPKKNKNAKFIEKISFRDFFDSKLNAIDLTSATICMENKINAILFDIDVKDSFINVLNDKIKKSVIHF